MLDEYEEKEILERWKALEPSHKLCPRCIKARPLAEFKKPFVYCQYCVADSSRRPNQRYAQQKGMQKSRGVKWTLTQEEFYSFLEMPCTYCKGKLGETGSSLDRIEPAKGYVMGNVQPCCPVCNSVRSNIFTVDEMHELGPVVAKIKDKRRKAGLPPPTTEKRKRIREMKNNISR